MLLHHLRQLLEILKEKIFYRIKEYYIEPGIVEFEHGIKLISSFKGECSGVKLYKNGTELLDLLDLVPLRVQLRFGEWCTSFDKPDEPIIAIRPIQNCEDLLVFLHEVGHACDPEISYLCFDLESKRFSMELGRMRYINFPEYVDMLWEEYQMAMRSEREAWAFALRTAHTLERKYTISILKNIGTAHDVQNIVHRGLDSYKTSFRPLFLSAKDTAERIKQIPH